MRRIPSISSFYFYHFYSKVCSFMKLFEKLTFIAEEYLLRMIAFLIITVFTKVTPAINKSQRFSLMGMSTGSFLMIPGFITGISS